MRTGLTPRRTTRRRCSDGSETEDDAASKRHFLFLKRGWYFGFRLPSEIHRPLTLEPAPVSDAPLAFGGRNRTEVRKLPAGGSRIRTLGPPAAVSSVSRHPARPRPSGELKPAIRKFRSDQGKKHLAPVWARTREARCAYCRPGVIPTNPARRNASAIASPPAGPGLLRSARVSARRRRFSDPDAAISARGV